MRGRLVDISLGMNKKQRVTAEMARLIDGAVREARELGIDTDTPSQAALYKE